LAAIANLLDQTIGALKEFLAAVADELAPHAVEGGYRLTSAVLVATARPV